MDKIRKFIEKKKVEAKFKKAGEGHSLAGSSGRGTYKAPPPKSVQPPKPTSAETEAVKRAAAEAALKRFEGGSGKPGGELSTTQKSIKAQARRELEKDTVGKEASGRSRSPTPLDHAPVVDQAVGGVFFTCELLPESVILTKEEMQKKVGEMLDQMFTEEPMMASTLMLYSLNSNPERRQVAIETIQKYLDNVIAHPEEEKYRKIRMGNKAFQERVLSAKGGKEFLLSVGFKEKMLSPSPNAAPELFLYIEEDAVNKEDMETAKAILMTGEPVPLKLHRNPVILQPGSRPLGSVELPDSFFLRTALEIKEEQKRRGEELEKMSTLRTREMRERDEAQSQRKYRYALIRVKFPSWTGDDSELTLQGTFGTAESFSEVRSFVQGFLDADWAPFSLLSPASGAISEDEKSIESLGLAPAAVLTFQWDEGVLAEWKKNNQVQPYLKKEWAVSGQCL